ncbi:MAG: UDP-2,3-diacylglucosamine diphosphatase LpxI [Acidobacteria bacterium]|nr:UDP-2,3-diacylglucosamine diphosphatase LpxI [Acidobacteriota bacterium]
METRGGEVKYGLIAGNGRFPLLVLESARARGLDIVVAAIRGETSPEIERLTTDLEWMGVGQLGKLLRFFKREQVTHAILAGQVKHVQIFGSSLPDIRMIRMLAGLKRKNTDSLIGAVVAELEKEGVEVIDSTALISDALAPAGVLTRRSPNRDEQASIDYGLSVAREIARLDLGQTIVVKDRAVVAIEAMEGTDATMLRAADLLPGKSLVIVKVAKPNQDMRFDVPVIGIPTIETMVKAHVTALSITAGKTLLIDRDELITLANRHRMAIVGNE